MDGNPDTILWVRHANISHKTLPMTQWVTLTLYLQDMTPKLNIKQMKAQQRYRTKLCHIPFYFVHKLWESLANFKQLTTKSPLYLRNCQVRIVRLIDLLASQSDAQPSTLAGQHLRAVSI